MSRLLGAAGIFLAVAVAAYFFLYRVSPAASAQELVALCAADQNGPMACYEREVPKLYPSASIPELFGLIRDIRRQDGGYQFCHVLAHKLGEMVVAEDPDSWISAMALNPSDGLCSNGFIHGVIVGRFRNDVLDEQTLENSIPDLARACEPRDDWQPSGLDQAICYHGMGHLLMFITEADIRRSLAACERIAHSPTGDYMRVCREGVYMQIYQPLEPDDFALIELLPEKPTRENYRRLCAAYKNDADEGACLREAWPLFREEIMLGSGVEAFCSRQPNPQEETMCFESATTIIGRQSLGNGGKAGDACTHLPRARQELCFTTVAQAIVEEDRTAGEAALALCKRAADDIAEACMRTIASRALWLFVPGSGDHERFCAQLPQKHQDICRRGP